MRAQCSVFGRAHSSLLLPPLPESDPELAWASDQRLVRSGLAEVRLCSVKDHPIEDIVHEQFGRPVRVLGTHGQPRVEQRVRRYVVERIAPRHLTAYLPTVVRHIGTPGTPVVAVQ